MRGDVHADRLARAPSQRRQGPQRSFGVGNSTASTALVEALHELRLFDPEVVGYMLAHSLKGQAFTEPTLRHRIENDQLELTG